MAVMHEIDERTTGTLKGEANVKSSNGESVLNDSSEML